MKFFTTEAVAKRLAPTLKKTTQLVRYRIQYLLRKSYIKKPSALGGVLIWTLKDIEYLKKAMRNIVDKRKYNRPPKRHRRKTKPHGKK